ncbi:MAG: GGDEF domain-containing protein, partial [Gimesia chilikensis]
MSGITTPVTTIALIGLFDFWTGPELSFSVFYLLPIGLIAWYVNLRYALLFCLVSSITWMTVDLVSGTQYSNQFIPVWNASVRFAFFLIVAVLLTRMHTSLTLQASLAQIDGLTGLINSRTFKDQCQLIFDLASRYKRTQALGYIDLDGFKGVNDTMGHHAGDLVLRG